MAKIGRPGFLREKKAELWERWKSGHCASDIARAMATTKGAIHHVLAVNGGNRAGGSPARRDGPGAFIFDVCSFASKVVRDDILEMAEQRLISFGVRRLSVVKVKGLGGERIYFRVTGSGDEAKQRNHRCGILVRGPY